MLRKFLLGLGIVLIVTSLYGGWTYYFWQRDTVSYPSAFAQSAIQPDAMIDVVEDPWLVFKPKAAAPKTGLIIYPGAQCDHQAYAPALRAIAEEGFLTVSVPMPLDMAIFGVNKAEDIMAAYPDIETWVIGGHSLGGGMAAMFITSHKDEIDGLLLWDSYTNAQTDISDYDVPVMQIHRAKSNGDMFDAFRDADVYLPSDMQKVAIPNGTHMQFGDFNIGPALTQGETWNPPAGEEIEQDQQRRIIIESSVAFLNIIANDG